MKNTNVIPKIQAIKIYTVGLKDVHMSTDLYGASIRNQGNLMINDATLTSIIT